MGGGSVFRWAVSLHRRGYGSRRLDLRAVSEIVDRGLYTVAFALVGFGCLSAVLLVLDVLLLDTLHVLDMVAALSRRFSGVYAGLNSVTFFLLCTGLALPPASRKVAAMYETVRTSSVIAGLEPVWGQAVAGNAGLTLDLGVVPKRPDRRRRELHRMVVEIQDSLPGTPK